MPTIRRIVTAQSPDGKSVFASEEELSPIDVGIPVYPVWGWDQTPTLPFPIPDGFPPLSLFPPADGVRVSVAEFPPGMGQPRAGATRANAEGLAALLTADGSDTAADTNPGLHATDTADIGVVISGEVWLELDDGAERLVRQGDIVFQMGTVHTWHNRTTEPCRMAMIVFGLRHAEAGRG